MRVETVNSDGLPTMVDRDRSSADDFVCEVCGATFETSDELGRHLRERGLVT